jgi:predicted NBD/HSP70 family sugar kinase
MANTARTVGAADAAGTTDSAAPVTPVSPATPAARPSPATPSTARAINDRAALDLFAARGPLTALALAEATGLAKPTVAELLARLQEGGLVEPAGSRKTDKRGPNAKLYALAAGRACVAGIDARAEVVHLSLADLAGRPLAETTVRIPPRLSEDAVPDLLVGELLALAGQSPPGRPAAPLLAVTIGMPGLVNPATGQIGPTPVVGPIWHQRLAAAVRERTGPDPAAVVLENEVNLAAIAEHRLLAGQGIDTFALLWLDTGVGAAIVLDGVLRRGASGGAGEIGFLPAPGARRRIDPDDGSSAGPSGICDLLDARSLAELTDPLPEADRLAAVAGQVIFGVAAFALTLDPGVVVLGGENGSAGGAELAALVERRLPEICPVPTRILPTAVPGNPILAGAVATALARARAMLWP